MSAVKSFNISWHTNHGWSWKLVLCLFSIYRHQIYFQRVYTQCKNNRPHRDIYWIWIKCVGLESLSPPLINVLLPPSNVFCVDNLVCHHNGQSFDKSSVDTFSEDSLIQVFHAALCLPAQIAFIQDVGQMSLRRFPGRYTSHVLLNSSDESAIQRSNQPLQKCSILSYWQKRVVENMEREKRTIPQWLF